MPDTLGVGHGAGAKVAVDWFSDADGRAAVGTVGAVPVGPLHPTTSMRTTANRSLAIRIGIASSESKPDRQSSPGAAVGQVWTWPGTESSDEGERRPFSQRGCSDPWPTAGGDHRRSRHRRSVVRTAPQDAI